MERVLAMVCKILGLHLKSKLLSQFCCRMYLFWSNYKLDYFSLNLLSLCATFFLQIITFQNWLRVSKATIISNGKPNNMSSVSLLMTLCIAGRSEVNPSLRTMNIRNPFYKFNIHSTEILSAFYIRIETHSVIETRVH